jgi:hypothetical protein
VDGFDRDQLSKLADRTRRAILNCGVGRSAGNGWRQSLTNSEEIAAQLQVRSAEAVGQKAEVADADQTGRQHVEQEAPYKLDCIQSHDLALAVVRIVLPLKTDAAVFKGAKAMVGDGHAVSIASQILQNALRPGEGRLDVNHPLDFGGVLTQGFECSGAS